MENAHSRGCRALNFIPAGPIGQNGLRCSAGHCRHRGLPVAQARVISDALDAHREASNRKILVETVGVPERGAG